MEKRGGDRERWKAIKRDKRREREGGGKQRKLFLHSFRYSSGRG